MVSFPIRPSLVVRAALWVLAANLAGPAFGGNPYHAIYERNVFHLRPPASVKTNTARAPLPRVRLTGITTILPGKRALLIVDFPVAKPQERPKEESYILAEGQRAGPIEVLAIDEKTAHVEVDDSGTITNLTFEKITTPHRPVAGQAAYRWGIRPTARVYH